jgi:hypothetical protein
MGTARRTPWRDMLHDYDLRAGRVWSLVLLAMLLGPEAVRRLR